MSYYQLPDRLSPDIPTINLNISPDEKGKDLIKHLPYLAQIEDPILQNKVEDLINESEDLQSYLFATEDLNRTLEESLQLAVGHGKINDASHVRHKQKRLTETVTFDRNSKDYKYFQENDNPLDVVFREKAKFDAQNPIIGSLLEEINKGKITEDGKIKAVKSAPNTKDLDLQDRFNEIFDKKKPKSDEYIVPPDSDDDDDDDDNLNLPNISDFFPPSSPDPKIPKNLNVPERRPKPGEEGDEWLGERTDQEYFFPFSDKHRDVDWKLSRRQII